MQGRVRPMGTKESQRVGVLFGGRSGEHEVSLNSAQNVMDALRAAGHRVVPIGITAGGHWLTDGNSLALLTETAGSSRARNGHGRTGEDAWGLLPHANNRDALPDIDIIFPVLHGTYGEDGTVQGLLEMANLPYVGCGVLASAAGMDKEIAKKLFAQAGLPQSPYRTLLRREFRRQGEAALAGIGDELGYPLFVKPANLGSSVGISRVADLSELGTAVELAARYDRKIVVEKAVANAREIEVSVLGNDEPAVSVPGEIITRNGFYDYAAKYLEETSELVIPAALTAGMTRRIQTMAIQAFTAIDGSGLARVDFLLDAVSGTVYLNEINTMPGFTRVSMYPKLWEASGISYPELVDSLLQLALERYAERQEICTVY